MDIENSLGEVATRVATAGPQPWEMRTSQLVKFFNTLTRYYSVCISTPVLGATVIHLFLSAQHDRCVEIIASDKGHCITPSWVSFSDKERLYVLLPSLMPNV